MTYTVHYNEPICDGAVANWSVVGMGPVAYCDSQAIAADIADRLNTQRGAVCPSCFAARVLSDLRVGRGDTKAACHYCGAVVQIRSR